MKNNLIALREKIVSKSIRATTNLLLGTSIMRSTSWNLSVYFSLDLQEYTASGFSYFIKSFFLVSVQDSRTNLGEKRVFLNRTISW